MMINNIMDAISNKLSEIFGQGYYIYGDTDIVQGLSPPCFFIAILEPQEDYLLGNRTFRRYPFDIHYYPTQDGNNTECYEVADTLLEALEYITLSNNDIIRGNSPNYQIIDGVLHFRISYNLFLKKEINQDAMESIEINTNIER